MDSPSPLSDLDKYEVVDDSEEEGGKEINAAYTLANDFKPAPSPENQQTKTPPVMGAAPIDYFAGFEEALTLDEPSTSGKPHVLPSIAERAKTRRRKTTGKPHTNVLELTDDDESVEAQSNKLRKSKPKGKASQISSEENRTSSPGTIWISRAGDQLRLPVINAKTKIRPRMKPVPPTLSPLHNQATIPVLTSTLPPPRNPFAESGSELPPSDPPMTSSLAFHEDMHVPPIEFLPLPQDDTDTPLPSSLAQENVDELQTHNFQHQSDHSTVDIPGLPPPPTFFAGSSSVPSANQAMLSAAKPPPSLPIDAIDLTDLPATGVTSPANMTDPHTSVKPRKPRKPRRTKGEAGGDTGAVGSTRSSKKGRSNTNKVTVEVLLPPPVHHSDQNPEQKHIRTRKAAEEELMEEDELNIQDGETDSLNTPIPGPSTLIESKRLASTDAQIIDQDDPLEKPSRSSKRKAKKRKEGEKVDGAPNNTTSRKRKKTYDENERQEDKLENIQSPSKILTRKRKSNDKELEPRETSDVTQAIRVIKGKGRMVIPSDDEDGDTTHPPVVEDALPSSPTTTPDEHRNRKHKTFHDNIEADADYSTNDTQGDRTVLKPTKPQTSSLTPDKVSAPHQRYETPSIGKYPSLSSRYTIAPKSQTTGMTELLRRVNSHPNSPFPAAVPGSPVAKLVYSPFLKSSRRTLSRIAPLHPNRKTPPPPLPPLPPKKKSKKELEMEEKWEEEIIEEIGGVSEWLALSEGEKKDLRRMKRDREMGYCED